MLFNSVAFAVFLPVVYVLYWALPGKHTRARNSLLLLASYFFYGFWDWRFLSLIFLSSLVDYWVGLGLAGEDRSPRARRALLVTSLVVNLGLLGTFKYFGFFVESFGELVSSFGLQPHLPSLRLVLPVGISFYTFQTLSYTIDVYRKEIPATRDALAFFTFVSFFPQLVAGPIERARDLLPQFLTTRHFDSEGSRDGLRRILWGLVKKVVVADNLAPFVEAAYSSPTAGGVALWLATVFFAVQIYCDFSGYSDIAIGTARLFGFKLTRNFAYPYFSRDIAEFWRRWHMSLSSWFRDYVYIPLGGSRVSSARRVRNVLVTFTVSGLWHGASWNFVIWGFLHGLYYVPLLLSGKQQRHRDEGVASRRLLPTSGEVLRMVTTFVLVLLAWVFFRASTLGQALSILGRMLLMAPGDAALTFAPIALVLLVLGLEWIQRTREHGLEIALRPVWMRWSAYYSMLLLLLLLGSTGHVPFLYFQF
jgi:D-alanyl-lipoteichoic acid acyltransferase DltB (MBOAT superfamily)